MTTDEDIIAHTQRLLDSIGAGDWAAYASLCDENLSAFEPDSRGHLVCGLGFHKYYFDLDPGQSKPPAKSTISEPNVKIFGDVAVIAYTRLVQSLTADGTPQTSVSQETRVWHKSDDGWKNVHFHRSAP